MEINNAEDSCCFRAPLVKPYIFDEIRPFYLLYGKADAFAFHSDTEVLAHNYDHDDRQQAYRFLGRWFDLPDKPNEIAMENGIDSYSQLAAGVPADNLTILGLARQFASQLKHPAVPTDGEVLATWNKRARETLSNVVHYQPVTVSQPWYVADTDHDTVESISIRFGFSNGLSATGVWIKSKWTPDRAPMTVTINDAGREGADREVMDHYPLVASQVEMGRQVLVLSILFTGDANPAENGAGRFGAMMQSVGTPPVGLEAAQLIAITRWAQQHWQPSETSLDSSGYRMQVVSLVAGSLEPHLFKSIAIRRGMKSLAYILDKPITSDRVPDMFCRGFYKDFDLNMLKAMAEPATVTETEFVDSVTPERCPRELSGQRSRGATPLAIGPD